MEDIDHTLPIFPSSIIRVVCISDTHNDDPRAHVPSGDIFIHAGDMTEHATIPEFQAVLDWVSSLPHQVKILVAGNRDASLDRSSSRFSQEALDLFTRAREKGIHYLDRETRTIAYYRAHDDSLVPIKVYGNPLQPDISPKRWPLTYPPYPSPESVQAWGTAPNPDDAVQIWVMHSPPLHRLDQTNVPGFTGCAVEAGKIAVSKPALCVFGHFHYSWGVERVRWASEGDGIASTQILTLSKERRDEQGLHDLQTRSVFDFSRDGSEGRSLEGERETIFVNAAWMTMKKTKVVERNMPHVILLTLGEDS